MKRSNYILQITVLLTVICFQCFVQSVVASGTDEDRPVTLRDVRKAPPKAVIPTDKYSNLKSTHSVKMIIPAGTYEVGDDQPVLKKLYDVADQLNSGTVTGDVIYELNATYDGTYGEILPVVFNQFTSEGGSRTVTIRVKAGVTARSTSGNANSPLIVFDGADNIILDGRPGGTGDAVEWNLHNSNYDGTGILFINDSKNNTVRNIDLISLNKNIGVITFGSTNGTDGNDNNTIAFCNIHDDGTDTPGYGIYSSGNTSDVNAFNSGNIIQNCNIYNIFHNDGWCESLFLEGGSTEWTITGNSFYQTMPRSTQGNDVTSFNIIDIMSGDGYTVTGNFIGGSAPQCGGAPWTVDGITTPKTFYGIAYTGRIGSNFNLTNNNTITNISFKYAFSEDYQNYLSTILFSGIVVTGGAHDITNNIFGSATGNGAIYCETGSTLNGNLYGLYYAVATGGLIDNNVFGGITINTDPMLSGGRQSPFDVYMIRINQEANTIPLTISHNLAGSLVTQNSINGTITGTTGLLRIQCIAVSSLSGQAEMNVIENTAANMIVNANTSNSFVKGIIVGSYYNGALISGNVVHDLINNSPNTSNNLTSCAILGMQFLISNPAVISNNEIYNLTSIHYQVVMAGMYFQSGPTSGQGTIERNFIHNLTNSNATANSVLYGMNLNQGSFNVMNNMISLGTNPNGSPMFNSSLITGIHEQAGNNNFYNNSVYIGGIAPSGTTAPTSCFNTNASSGAKKMMNNIFYNARSGGTGNYHYAIRLSTVTPLLVTSNYNIFFVTGVGGMLGHCGSDYFSLYQWKTVTGQDMSSGWGDPHFISPEAASSLTDLHLADPTPAEGSGIAVDIVTTDFDGQTRSDLTPSDIGADAGNFAVSADIFGPEISYTPLSNSGTGSRMLENFARITDNKGVAIADNRPRFYFKRSTDWDVFGGNTSSDNGWKYVQALSDTTPYTFLVDHSLLYGGAGNSGDIIQYFVAAQDINNNLNSFPLGASAGVNPPIQNIWSAPSVPNQYLITTQTIGGVIHLPNDYPTLTGPGGLFEKINNSLVTHDLFIFINSGLTEPGTNALNEFSTYPEDTSFNMSMYPIGPVMCTVTGNVPAGLIRINGADNITIGGNYGFQGTFLKFVNTSSAGPVFLFSNDAHSITLKELIIEGTTTASGSGVILIGGSGQASGNHHLDFRFNKIRNLSSGTGIPYSMLTSNGTITRPNHDITIYKNEIFNYSGAGINITSTGNGNNFNIDGNHFYCNASFTASPNQYGIYAGPGAGSSGITIVNNFIGGTGPEAGYGQWITGASSFYSIIANAGSENMNSIENNTIRNISMNNASTAIFHGINATGWFDIVWNTIGNLGPGMSITKEAQGNMYAIIFSGPFDRVNEIHFNTVGGIRNGGSSGYTTGLYITGMVNMSYNMAGIPDFPGIESATQYNTVGILANISGYLGFNTVGGILLTNQYPGDLYGLYLSGSFPKIVESNQVMNCGPGSSSLGNANVGGILNNMTGTGTASFVNNVISLGHDVANAHSYFGIYDAGANGTSEYYFNSISLGGNSPNPSASFGFYKDGSGASVVKDNIFANFRTGAGHQCSMGIAGVGTASVLNSDYNDVYSVSGEDVFREDQYLTLEEWQAAYMEDLHSVSADPLYNSATVLKPCSQFVEDTGIAIPSVPVDFNVTVRNDPPDLGAFEFDLPEASITAGTADDFCNGIWLTANSTANPATYLWSTGSTDQSILLNIADNTEGTYSVYVFDDNGCSSLAAAEYYYSPEDLTGSYTLLGFHEMQVGESNAVLNGSVGLTSTTATASVKKNAVINGPGSFVKAVRIDANPTAVIRQKIYSPVTVTLPDMQYNTITGTFTNRNVPNNTTVTINDNYINLTAGQNCRITLTGSIFGNIQVDKGTTITFSSSSLDIGSIRSLPGTSAAPVRFVFQNDAVIRVKTKVDLDNYMIMNPDNRKIIFYIGQQTGNSALLQIKPTGTIFNGSAYVPSGMIKVPTDGNKNTPALITGKFIADKLLASGKYVIWNWYDCASVNPVPVLAPMLAEEPAENGNEGLTISPVPNNGTFRIQLTDAEAKAFTIQIFNSLGVEVRKMNAETVSGILNEMIDLRPAIPGVYTVVVVGEETKLTGKVIIK